MELIARAGSGPVREGGVNVIKRILLGALGVFTSMGLLPTVFAEERSGGGYLEEIIVTGTKRAAAQQDTPIAISTLSANDINKTFGNDIRAISDLAPNVTLTNQTGFNALAGGIRGTGTISILTTQDPSVGLLVDEFALNHVQTQFAELFDIEQVEIYRGPQGTLFGKNSTGGTIAITSKRPDLDEFGADIKLSVGGYDGGSDNYKAQVGIDVPLIEGKLGFRFAGSLTKEDGYYTNDKDTALFPNNIFGLTEDNVPDDLDTTTVGDGGQLDGKDVVAAKTKLLWTPNDRYEAYFIWEILRDDSDSPPGINETPAGEGFLLELLGFPGFQTVNNDPFSTGVTNQGNGINIPNGHEVEADGYYLTQTFSFDRGSIKSITGYREQSEILPSTYTGEAFTSLFDASRNLKREQFQQELRFVSEFDGPLNFVAGGIYLTDDLDFTSYSTQGLTSIIPLGFDPDTGTAILDQRNLTGDPGFGTVKQDRESWAVYADGTFQINDQFSLTAGARYTKDKKEFYKPTGVGGPCNQYTEAQDAVAADPDLPFDPVTNCSDLRSTNLSRTGLTTNDIDPFNSPVPASAYAFIADEKESWDEVTWRVVLDYKPSDNQLYYASVATGFLAGGFSETCSRESTCVAYDPEENINYEIGFKGDLLDDRLRLNVAAFWTEYESLQRNQVFPFITRAGLAGQETLTLNVGDSEVKGIEVETTWLVTDRFQLKGSVGWTDGEYKSFTLPGEFKEAPGVDLTVLDIPFLPEWQIGVQAIFDQALPNGGTLTYIAGLHHQSEAETSPVDPNAAQGTNAAFDSAVARQPSLSQMEKRTLVDANITYTSPDERYYVTAYGKNLLNEKYRVSSNSVGALWNFTYYGAPLQWGVELGFQF
jgi:iron complex outermembrane receptor protein